MDPVLLPGDLLSPTWAKIKAHYESRLQDLRVQNDKRSSADDTARLRGQIFEVKQLLSLSSPATPKQEGS